MHTLCNFIKFQRSLEGDLILMLAVDDDPAIIDQMESLKNKELVLDISKYSKRRSLNANAYFWTLCDLIAKKLGTDKDSIYKLMLRDYGVFEQIDVIDKAVDLIKPLFRFVEEDHSYSTLMLDQDGNEIESTMIALHCYKGSHEYDTKQMSDLIQGTLNCAHDLGLDTWTEEEINNLISRWEKR